MTANEFKFVSLITFFFLLVTEDISYLSIIYFFYKSLYVLLIFSMPFILWVMTEDVIWCFAGITVDQGVAYVLMMLALALTYIIH